MKTDSVLKLLTGAGLGSRRRMADAIREGRVTLNGSVVADFRQPVSPADQLLLDGSPVSPRLKPVYLLMNKPAGVLTTTGDQRRRRTVLDLLPAKYRLPGLFPVGRLDRESSGLLLLTNDGELTYRLTHPRFEHQKEYLVQTDRRLQPGEMAKLAAGISLEDGLTAPAAVREVSALSFHYAITIHEGKNRQVRRMFAALGYRVLALKRVRMGSLRLGALKEGEVRELRQQEIRALAFRQAAGAPPAPRRASSAPSPAAPSTPRPAGGS